MILDLRTSSSDTKVKGDEHVVKKSKVYTFKVYGLKD